MISKRRSKGAANGFGQQREHSSAGRASALQAEGHRFEPCCSHQTPGPVAQLVRAPACHVGGRGFEPLPGRIAFALVAQSVEQQTENLRVGGSIPPQGTIRVCGSSSVGRAPPCQGGGRESEPRLPLHFLWCHSQVVRQRSAKPLCPGSNPGGTSQRSLSRPIGAGCFVWRDDL